jgi:hypothetical protein
VDLTEIIKIIWPVVLIQLAFQIYALIDLFKTKKSKTKNLSAPIWAVIIILGEMVGPAVYLIVGRSE